LIKLLFRFLYHFHLKTLTGGLKITHFDDWGKQREEKSKTVNEERVPFTKKRKNSTS
jgi:hypothetical protein